MGFLLWGLCLWGGIQCSPNPREVQSAMRELAARPVRSLSDTTPGPGLFHGQLMAAADAPQSKADRRPEALALIECREKISDEMTLLGCSRQMEPTGLFSIPAPFDLVADGQRVRLDIGKDLGRPWLRAQLEDLPWSRSSDAPPSCRWPGLTEVYRREVVIPLGTEVWISGCRRGDVISRCEDDRADLIVVGSRKLLPRYLLQSKTEMSSIAMILGLCGFLLALSFAAAPVSVPSRRS